MNTTDLATLADTDQQRRLLNTASKWMTEQHAEWPDLARSDTGRALGIRPTGSPRIWEWPEVGLTIVNVE